MCAVSSQRCCRGEYRQHSKGTPRRENPYPVRALEADRRTRPGGEVHRPLRMVNNNYQLYPQTPGVHGAQGFRENRLRELQDQKHPQDRAGGTVFFDGEIPAIVDEETWNTVQRLMGTKRRAPKRQTTPNRLTGLLYCADCRREADPPQQPCARQVSGRRFCVFQLPPAYPRLYHALYPHRENGSRHSCCNPARELVCAAQCSGVYRACAGSVDQHQENAVRSTGRK